jgi:hypothetical protein
MKLFTATTGAFCDDALVEMPGFSHRSQPFNRRVLWYPWEEATIRVWLYAKNRSDATRQLVKIAGRRDIRDLSDGAPCKTPECIDRAFNTKAK